MHLCCIYDNGSYFIRDRIVIHFSEPTRLDSPGSHGTDSIAVRRFEEGLIDGSFFVEALFATASKMG